MSGWPTNSRYSAVVLTAVGLALLVWITRHAPPFREVSDGAILEIYTIEALKGTLLVGPYSKFGWHHPGPLYFYLLAPWYWLSGMHTAGVQAGALAINLAAVLGLAWTIARVASTATALAICAAVAAYISRTGDMIVSVWNPHIIVLPMLMYIALAAAFAASGRGAFLVWMAALGSFLVQTHLAMAPVVAAVGGVAVAAVLNSDVLKLEREAPAERSGARAFFGCAALLAFVLWLPPIVEQITHRPGNLASIVMFFAAPPPGGGQSLTVASVAWASALTAAFRRDFVVAMGLDFAPAGGALVPIAVAAVTALVACAVAARRFDRFAMWMSALCAVATAAALVETTRIRDQIIDHEIFWMSALGVLDAAAIVAALAAAVARPPKERSPAVRLAPAIAVVAALAVGAQGMRHVMGRQRTTDDHSVDVLAEAIEQRLAAAGSRRPLFHIEHGVWPVAAGALLQLHKKRVVFAVDDRWASMFGEAFAANGREDLELTLAGSPLQPLVRGLTP